MSTWPFKKVNLKKPLDRLVSSVPLPPHWQGASPESERFKVEAALIRIPARWDAIRFEKKLLSVVEMFPLLRASLSPSSGALAIHEMPKLCWRKLDQVEILQQIVNKGWSPEFNHILQLNRSTNQLWEALIAVDEEESFLVCLTALPIIADANMLHAALGHMLDQFKGQGPSQTQREIVAHDRLAIFHQTAWNNYHSPVQINDNKTNPTLVRQAELKSQGGSCSFRLPSHTWQKLSTHARSQGLPSFAVAAILMRAALSRLLGDAVGAILIKSSLRLPKNIQTSRGSGWDALELNCRMEDHYNALLQAIEKVGWHPVPSADQKHWAEGLWIGIGLLPSCSESQQLRILSSDEGPTQLLWLCPDGDGETFLTWQENCFEEEFPLSLAALLKELAELWSESPESPLQLLPIQSVVLPLWQRWNSTYQAFQLEQTIPQLLAPSLARAADRIAIRSRGGKLSYRELDNQSRQLALLLKSQGIGPGDLIGIALPRSPAMVVALLGVLRSGAGYVPLDSAFPTDRLQFMLNDSRVKACFCDELLESTVARSCPPLIWNEIQTKFSSLDPQQWKDPAQDPSSIAYVIYTSGSTGQPKGVMIGHRSVVNFLLSMQQKPGIESTDSVLAITTLSFDIAALELLLPLLAGASLYLTSADEAKDGQLLGQLLEQENISIVQATPSYFRLLLDSGWKGTKLRKALCGGEAFPIDIARRLLPVIPELWNMYGPTETTVWSTLYRITHVDGIIPIGHPIANTAVYILDDQLKPVLPGEKGDIYIGGSGLALGYFGRTDLTLERFVMIPGLAVLAYKTGDIGRYSWSGMLEIFGRSDHQIKLRGYRMELGEIEGTVSSLPGIELCVAAVKEFGSDDPRLIAYVIVNDKYQERQVRQLMKDRLPSYMLPGHYQVLSKMPLLANGKIDRQALPHPRDIAHQGQEKAADPLVFQASPIKSPVDESLAKEALTKHVEATRFPMTPSQSRMLFTEELDPETTVHNLIGAWVIRGVMDFQAFRKSLEALIIEQDSLRMAVVQTAEGSALELSPPFAPELRIYGREKPNMTMDDVQTAIIDLGREKLDVTQVPNFRMGIFRLNTDATVFFLITHHIFWDGFSYGVLWKNIQRLYKEILVSGRARFKPPAFNFSHYAQQRQKELQASHMQDELNYWLKTYQTIPDPLELAYDFSRPATLKHEAATAWIPWDDRLDARLQETANAFGCTLYHVLLSAYYVLLYRLSGQKDLVIGSPVHGRQQVEVFDLLGNFINVVAMRQILDPDMSFQNLVETVKSSTHGAMAHCDLPFEHLVAALKLPRDAGRTPLYNTMFFFQDQSQQKVTIGTTVIESLRLPNTTVDTDLILWIERYAQSTFAGFNYRVDLWEKATVESFGQSYRQILDELLAFPQKSLRQHPILCLAQKELLLKTWNESSLPAPALQTITAILDERACLHPEAIAVCDLLGNKITWRELDQKSRQLSKLLTDQGIKSGDVVGICLPRNIELIIGLLAIIRSGAAYLPLDPMFPFDRLKFMLEDSKAIWVLSDSSYQPMLQDCPCKIISIDRERATWERFSIADDQNSGPIPSDVAYVIYTSGSTGKPKGVEIQHKAVATFLQSFRAAVEIPEIPQTLAITTISFDISVLEIFGTLAWGGTVVIVDQEKTLDGPGLIKAITDHRINLLQATPATWRLLLDARWFGNQDLTALSGGEALSKDLARELLPRTRALWNVYGPTETTVWATASKIHDAETAVTIGRVLPHYEAFILDHNLLPLPIGAIGTLYLGGPALAKSYKNRPDLTTERFIPHPFQLGQRVYDTGDLCRFRADGRLEYISRKDNQIKLRGYRIELGEIEESLVALPEIKQAVVIVREDRPGDKRLVAYVLPTAGSTLTLTLTLSQMQQQLKMILPSYMLPNHIVTLDQYPLTGSGKIDKKALPQPSYDGDGCASTQESQTKVDDLNPQEQSLAEIWRDMIGLNKVRRSDNFFDLGGHSLLALKVLHRCQQELGADFKIRDLLLMDLQQLAAQLPKHAAASHRAKGERS